MISNLFLDSVEEAVSESLKSNRTLVVYNSNQSDDWLNKWFQADDSNVSHLKGAAVWLKLVKGTAQFQYFEQVFPNVVVPSVYLVLNGKIKTILQGDATHIMWGLLLQSLGIVAGSIPNHEEPKPEVKKKPSETFRESVQEISQQVYHDEVVKERKADREERERILKLLEADKEERKAAETHSQVMDSEPVEVRDNIKDRTRLHTANCTLQIRLTNSETLTRTFKSNDILNEVRTWVDVNRTDGDHPYAFHRNIPRMTFSDSDEMKTLEELELTPRSALILKPLDIVDKNIKIAEAQQAGLLNKVYSGFSSWWGSAQQQQQQNMQVSSTPYSRPEHNDSQQSSSRIVPQSDSQINREQSETNIQSRSVTPNVYQLINSDDVNDDQEKNTYNGNNISLEKNDDDK
ncbi:similar to Saccharomyces cerevisiae YJL048C UBX6 UBX (ubiquitin regulatory X) domain-containing protein that interacts with Cdc48p [Maudiozyma barnettii]|uniref:Similar to Saccharomyces cerevisiae YJL048C UBX6 UBX (Ubiquitin regulatory X) domain-containing protein that interacts with Cdc48p n=1 Tax=Maudiozyma barnettii TaxID=61262 RepID=A0A8H2ZFI5_9SACH|nr:Ubx6p [Kazachstania barnettii]CAB4253271.1 similar to Saccharomyces cerevisiae YJL048C UBX6 UBX (ubiquitin regulatory X) domain-containing protein that interacts with Cdc48p [Kazachstania barnettii]CAD1780193.1 similar to Saccharomyces cerevisiae YJL048C UBX6 UBX (ubiquitin regulatory X) domain-containing protein that interacts with Cdc48p [Kazachstania barnettii]